MPMMTMPRNWTVRTTSGPVIRFRKNEPVHVPNDGYVIEECRKYGAEYVNAAEQVLPDEDAPVTNLPETPEERKKRIRALCREMIKRPLEHRNHFTARNQPSAKYMSNALGFDVSAKEIDVIWSELNKPATTMGD